MASRVFRSLLVLAGLSPSCFGMLVVAAGSASADEFAISLGAFQADLADCQAAGRCDERILRMDGMTRIDGFVVDGSDLVLFGAIGPDAPPIHTADLAIALRNVWLRYAPLVGGVHDYEPPGVTIEPREASNLAMKAIGDRLDEIEQTRRQLARALVAEPTSRGRGLLREEDRLLDEAVEAELGRWREECFCDQDVELFGGVPASSHFATTMYWADYRTKLIADSTLDASLAGMPSRDALTRRRYEQALRRGQIPARIPTTTRYEFVAGEQRLERSATAVRIVRSQVLLEDEAQQIEESGEAVGTGVVNAQSREWARLLTKKMRAIGRLGGDLEVYAELEQLFRLVVLSKAVRQHDAVRLAHIAFLVDHFDLDLGVTGEIVPETVAGVPGLLRASFGPFGRIARLDLRAPSCGGVRIQIELSERDYARASSRLLDIQRRVLDRPRRGPRSWRLASPSARQSRALKRLAR